MSRNFSLSLVLLSTILAAATLPAGAASVFWIGPGTDFNTASNWEEEAFMLNFVPGPGDLAIHDNEGGAVVNSNIDITADAGSTQSGTQGVDSLRLSHGGSVTHTAGTLNVTFEFLRPDFTVANDNGLWVGEFGNQNFDKNNPSASPQSVYALSGGVINIDDSADSLIIGRGPEGLVTSGGATEFADGRMDFSGGTINSAGDVVVGSNGHGQWDQSGGTLNSGDLFVGRFQSPSASANLSGNAVLNVGSLLVADSQTDPRWRVGRPEGSGSSDVNITGSNVDINVANNLFLRGNTTLNFVADSGGISPLDVNGTTIELSDTFLPGNRPELAVDLSAWASAPADITLIDGSSVALGEFMGLPEGSTHPSFGGRTLTYQGGGDGFDIQLVTTYIPPPPTPVPANAIIGRWNMTDVQGTAPADPGNTSFFGNPSVFDSATGSDEGILPGDVTNNGDVGVAVDHLWFFSADNGQDYVSSGTVPPTAMFINGNNGGTESYDASAVEEGFVEGALFFPQDIYGNEFSFEGSFSVEAFIKTGDNVNAQQIIVQGEGFNRYGLSMNDETEGAIRLTVSDGTESATEGLFNSEFIEIDGDFGDDEWHYILATFEADAGANGTGQLTLSIADEDGTTVTSTQDLTASFGGLPPAFNDGNFLIGAVDFDGNGVTPEGSIGPIDPKTVRWPDRRGAD